MQGVACRCWADGCLLACHVLISNETVYSEMRLAVVCWARDALLYGAVKSNLS